MQVDDVVITDGSAGVDVSYDGGVLEADGLRIVNNSLDDDRVALWCGGTCTLVNSEISGNIDDSYGNALISISSSASVVLEDTNIDNNDVVGSGVYNKGGYFSMTGGSLTGNSASTIVVGDCYWDDPSTSEIHSTRVGNNTAESDLVLSCGCDSVYGFVTSTTEEVRTIVCDGEGDQPTNVNAARGYVYHDYGWGMDNPGESCLWATEFETQWSASSSCPDCEWAFIMYGEDDFRGSTCSSSSWTNPWQEEYIWWGATSDYRGSPAIFYGTSSGSMEFFAYATKSGTRFDFTRDRYDDYAYGGYYFTDRHYGYFEGYDIYE